MKKPTQEQRQGARTMVHFALRKKIINKPRTCELCHAKKKLHAHHDDYFRPLDVRWLCVKCHFSVHRRGVPTEQEDNVVVASPIVLEYLREFASLGGEARARKGHDELSKIALRGAATRKANGNRRKATR